MLRNDLGIYNLERIGSKHEVVSSVPSNPIPTFRSDKPAGFVFVTLDLCILRFFYEQVGKFKQCDQ